MKRLSFRNKWLKFKIAGKLPIDFRAIYRIYPNLIKKTGGCQPMIGENRQLLTDEPFEFEK
jgi:hypothetical protein